MTTPPAPALDGLRIIELTDEKGVWAGKLLADMGANVIKIEPPSGDPTRSYAPFLDDEPGPERSLYFWHYNTSKRGITLDIETEQGRALFKRLVEGADAVVESQRPGRLRDLGIDYADVQESNPGLIWVSITPYGREGPRAQEEATDLTLSASGGIAWMNGYDDHSLPPVRGGGNQGYHTGCHYGVMSFLVALLSRDVTGHGQFIDVNTHASCNVTTESGSYSWLVAQATVSRQTGRHASVRPSLPSQVKCSDGRYVNTGVPPRRPHDFEAMLGWLESLGLLEAFPQTDVLRLAAEGDDLNLADIAHDEVVAMKIGAGRDAMTFVAEQIPAYEYFSDGQARGFQVGVIHSPEEMLADPHFVARGFPVEVEHPELGRTFTYPGAPYKLPASPWRIRRRAPLLGEDNVEVYGEIGLGESELAELRSLGVI